MSENLEKSELVFARILEKLMEFGLQSPTLQFDEVGLSSDFSAFWTVSCDWLIDEGIVRASNHSKWSNGASILVNPVLTAYGISLLGTKLGPVENPKLLKEAVNEVSRSQKSYSELGDMFGGVLGGMIKSLGS